MQLLSMPVSAAYSSWSVVSIVKFVDHLPMTATGKILKRELH
ncbi:hypothetical protein [Streptomyces javensis]